MDEFKEIKRLDMWMENVRLEYSRDRCVGCSICVDCCPKEALKLNTVGASVKEIIEEPPVEIDKDKCVLCGVCVALCPRDALRIFINDEERCLISKNEGLPEKIRFEGKVEVDQEKCPKGCRTCECICKEEAIDVDDGIRIDEDRCTLCGACSIACPADAITVVREKIVYDELGTCRKIESKIMDKVSEKLLGEVKKGNETVNEPEGKKFRD